MEVAGVDVAALEAAAAAGGAAAKSSAVARSSSTLLVKNLPYSATEAELEVGQSWVVLSFPVGQHRTLMQLTAAPTALLSICHACGQPHYAPNVAWTRFQ